MSISKERREELREALQAMADGDGLMIPYRDAVALLDTADELDRLTLDAEDQSWREALADAADLDITGSDVRGDREQPHTPTVAAALREVGLCMFKQGVRADPLFERAAEIMEGREDG
jgi:uncharacterized membrane protein